MKKTKFSLKLLEIEFTKSEAASPPANAKKSPPECHHVEPMERNGDPAKERSEMPVTSEENAQAKTPDSIEQKTSWKKVVLVVLLVIIAIIAACTANTPLVNDALAKLVEWL
ncbi:MAG: hypothetical protein K2N56_05170 [Oscillospiraceae bacterium]|nr:hypothetical protein [Oscillospiraceae bacterium]